MLADAQDESPDRRRSDSPAPGARKLSFGCGKYTVKLADFGGAVLAGGARAGCPHGEAAAAVAAADPEALPRTSHYCAPEVCFPACRGWVVTWLP